MKNWVENMQKLIELKGGSESDLKHPLEQTNISLPEKYIRLCKSVGIEIV